MEEVLNNMSIGQQHRQGQPYPKSVHNTLYHSHLRLSSAHPQTASSPTTTTDNANTSYSPNPNKAMVSHIANLASDKIQVQTASTVQYHRARLQTSYTVAITHGPSPQSHRRPVRHLRHPSNLPIYTTSLPNHQDTHRGNSRRLRDSLRPLFHIFSPNNNGPDSPSSSPTTPEHSFDDSKGIGSKARVLQESSVNTHQHHHHRQTASRGSTSTNTSDTSIRKPFRNPSTEQRPTRYFRREQSRDAFLEELKSEGLLGPKSTSSKPALPPFASSASSSSTATSKTTKPFIVPTSTMSTTNKKRKGRGDDSSSSSSPSSSPVLDLEKPLPPLIPDQSMRTREERYWAGVADDIARRASMLN